MGSPECIVPAELDGVSSQMEVHHHYPQSPEVTSAQIVPQIQLKFVEEPTDCRLGFRKAGHLVVFHHAVAAADSDYSQVQGGCSIRVRPFDVRR